MDELERRQLQTWSNDVDRSPHQLRMAFGNQQNEAESNQVIVNQFLSHTREKEDAMHALLSNTLINPELNIARDSFQNDDGVFASSRFNEKSIHQALKDFDNEDDSNRKQDIRVNSIDNLQMYELYGNRNEGNKLKVPQTGSTKGRYESSSKSIMYSRCYQIFRSLQYQFFKYI